MVEVEAMDDQNIEEEGGILVILGDNVVTRCWNNEGNKNRKPEVERNKAAAERKKTAAERKKAAAERKKKVYNKTCVW